MPKMVDYAGRFSFFEEACFAIVRDHGVEELSRNRLAAVLGTSSSTVRRLLSSHADLRHLVLEEVRQRRARHRLRPRGLTGVDEAVALLRRLLPDSPQRIAEELVWWRLAIAAPTVAVVPPDEVQLDEGPLHHRFAIANLGFVPRDVLAADLPPPRTARAADGELDPVVAALDERQHLVAEEVTYVVRSLAPALGAVDEARSVRELHALLDGLGIAVCLGRMSPDEAVTALAGYLRSLG